MFVSQVSRLSWSGRLSEGRPAPAGRPFGAVARKRRLSLHWFGHSLKRPFLAGTLALVCIDPFSANAQSTVSGGLSIQMQVGSGSPTLGANPGTCRVGTTPIDFGKVTPGARGLVVAGRQAIGSVSVRCSPPAHLVGTTQATVDYSITSKHQLAPGVHLMTLNDADITDGIGYTIARTGQFGGGLGSGGSLLANVEQLLVIGEDTTSFPVFGRVSGTTYPDGQIPSGIYRDTLTFTLFF